LSVAMDPTHPLLQSNRIPRDIVVDHEPAELEIDSLASRFGRDHDLAILAELPLGTQPGAGLVAVPDLHAAVDLGDRESPFTELAHGSAVLAVAHQEVESVLVL